MRKIYCSRCGKEKEKKYRFKGSYCKKCAVERVRDYEQENPEKYINSILKCRYGIDCKEYEDLVKKQKGKCAICKKEYLKKLYIDHNHSTNKVRGLLCPSCNMTLGLVYEDIGILKNMISYLEKNNSRQNENF